MRALSRVRGAGGGARPVPVWRAPPPPAHAAHVRTQPRMNVCPMLLRDTVDDPFGSSTRLLSVRKSSFFYIYSPGYHPWSAKPRAEHFLVKSKAEPREGDNRRAQGRISYISIYLSLSYILIYISIRHAMCPAAHGAGHKNEKYSVSV